MDGLIKWLAFVSRPLVIIGVLGYLGFMSVTHWFKSDAIIEYDGRDDFAHNKFLSAQYDFIDLENLKQLAVRIDDGNKNMKEHCWVVLYDIEKKIQLPARNGAGPSNATFSANRGDIFDCRKVRSRTNLPVEKVSVIAKDDQLIIQYPPTPVEKREGEIGWLSQISYSEEFGEGVFQPVAIDPVQVDAASVSKSGEVSLIVSGKTLSFCCLPGFNATEGVYATATRIGAETFFIVSRGVKWAVYKAKD